jgi:YggT family protein
MFGIIAGLINTLTYLFVIIIVIDSAVSFFLSPYHPVRSALDRLVGPMLAPIRRVVPPAGGFDFSPMVLIILIIIISSVLVRFLNAL